jgi:exodeoxyribonuclease VIII
MTARLKNKPSTATGQFPAVVGERHGAKASAANLNKSVSVAKPKGSGAKSRREGMHVSVAQPGKVEALAAAPSETAPQPDLLRLMPGLYPGLSWDDYRAIRAINKSTLDELDGASPQHLRHSLDSPSKKKTPALIFGDAAHVCVLQPNLYGARFAVAQQCCETTEKRSRCSYGGKFERDGRWYCSKHDPLNNQVLPGARIVLPQDDHDTIQRMRDAFYADPRAKALMAMKGPVEVSGVFTDEDTGELCKMRGDKLLPDIAAVGDYKTAECAKRAPFVRSIRRFGYHRQGAMYVDGVNSIPGIGAYDSFLLMAQEKVEPFAVGIYRLRERSLNKGRREIARMLWVYARCRRENFWPGYGVPGYDWELTPEENALAEAEADSPGKYLIQDIELEEWDLREAA